MTDKHGVCFKIHGGFITKNICIRVKTSMPPLWWQVKDLQLKRRVKIICQAFPSEKLITAIMRKHLQKLVFKFCVFFHLYSLLPT